MMTPTAPSNSPTAPSSMMVIILSPAAGLPVAFAAHQEKLGVRVTFARKNQRRRVIPGWNAERAMTFGARIGHVVDDNCALRNLPPVENRHVVEPLGATSQCRKIDVLH